MYYYSTVNEIVMTHGALETDEYSMPCVRVRFERPNDNNGFDFAEGRIPANENPDPPHVHVSKGRQTAGATKFWLRRDGVELAHNDGQIPARDLRKIEAYLLANQDRILAERFRFFNM